MHMRCQDAAVSSRAGMPALSRSLFWPAEENALLKLDLVQGSFFGPLAGGRVSNQVK